MNTDLIQSITQQAAVIIVNTIFFSTVIRPRRLSVPMTRVCSQQQGFYYLRCCRFSYLLFLQPDRHPD